MVSKNSGKSFDRVVQSPEGISAVMVLMDALEQAQLTLASIDKNTPASFDVASKLRDQTAAITHASSALKLIWESQKMHVEVDDAQIISSTCSVTVDALDRCFKATPFRLERGTVLAAINQMTPHENLKYQRESPLIVLRHYTTNPGTTVELTLLPCLGTIFDSARVWTTNILKENTFLEGFRRVVHDYEPNLPHEDLASLLKCSVDTNELIPNFQARINDRLSSAESSPIRIAVCGMYSHGKSTILNALIEEDIISIDNFQDSPSTNWPIVVQYSGSSKEAILTVNVAHFVPLVQALDENPPSIPDSERPSDLIERVKMAASCSTGPDFIFNGKKSIASALRGIGMLVRAFYKVPSDRRRRYTLDENWPVLEAPMTLLQTVHLNVQFVDLPGFDCIHRDSTVVQAQWQSELKRCDGGIIVFPCDGSVLASKAFDVNMRLLAHFNSFKKKPWVAIGTKLDNCSKDALEAYEGAFRAASWPIVGLSKTTPVTFCSAQNYLAARGVERLLNRDLRNLPPLSELNAVRGAEYILRGMHEAINSHNAGELFARLMRQELIKSNVEAVVENVRTSLVNRIPQFRVKTLAKTTLREVDKIRRNYDSIITAAFSKKEDIDTALSLCQDFQSEVASFCTNWSITKAQIFIDAKNTIRLKISRVIEDLRKEVENIWRSSWTSHASMGIAISREEMEEIWERITQTAATHQINIVLDVLKISRQVWGKRLSQLHKLFDNQSIIRRTDDVSMALRQEIKEAVNTLIQQPGNISIQSYLEKLNAQETRSSQDANATIWSALSTAPDSYQQNEGQIDIWQTSVPKTSPPGSSFKVFVETLKGWIRDEVIRAEGLNAFGFLLVPPISIGESFQYDRARMRSLGGGTEHLRGCIDRWGISISAQSYRTLYGALNGLTIIGMETVLDAFSSVIQQLQEQAEKYDQGKVFTQNEYLLEDVIVAQVNAGCAWAALAQLLKEGP
ncbi:hypothetical protein FRC17_011182 [Serendipita sp. 399]|nr:hypothetical protein FRC17_011182 [Serendipita sp. 399]